MKRNGRHKRFNLIEHGKAFASQHPVLQPPTCFEMIGKKCRKLAAVSIEKKDWKTNESNRTFYFDQSTIIGTCKNIHDVHAYVRQYGIKVYICTHKTRIESREINFIHFSSQTEINYANCALPTSRVCATHNPRRRSKKLWKFFKWCFLFNSNWITFQLYFVVFNRFQL